MHMGTCSWYLAVLALSCCLTLALLAVPRWQAAERTPDLSTLATALATVGRADTFRNPTLTYTVFAPTSECRKTHGRGSYPNTCTPRSL